MNHARWCSNNFPRGLARCCVEGHCVREHTVLSHFGNKHQGALPMVACLSCADRGGVADHIGPRSALPAAVSQKRLRTRDTGTRDNVMASGEVVGFRPRPRA